MKAKWLINPFERIAGWQALGIGVVALALTSVFGSMNGVFFSGMLQIAPVKHDFVQALQVQALNWLIPFLTLWLAGVCFSKAKIRVIDVAGTTLLARVPLLLMVVICFLPVVPASFYDIPRLVVFAVIYIPVMIWIIFLMYNAFSVSCHMKGGLGMIVYIGSIIIAEVILGCIYFFLLSYLFTNTPVSASTETNTDQTVVVTADTSTIRQKMENIVLAFEQGELRYRQ